MKIDLHLVYLPTGQAGISLANINKIAQNVYITMTNINNK